MSLAYYYEDRGDWENAETNARKALEINPDCLANSLLGHVIREQDRNDEAKILRNEHG
jgi:Tfp pilus assembly protein PilF